MSEPDWRHRPGGDSASNSSMHAHVAHPDTPMDFTLAAESSVDTAPAAGVALTEVWEYLGKH